MIPFSLIGTSFGEIGDHTIETLASTQIRRDLYTVAGAGVRSGQRPAADGRIKDELVGRHALYLRQALHVSQLTPVEFPIGWAAKLPEEDIARGLHQPLTGNDALSLVLVDALREVNFQHRSLRLLDLEKQRVILIVVL